MIGKPDFQQSSSFMRELVASTVMSQPEEYNEALLGKPIKEYSKWILQVFLTKKELYYYI